MEKTSKPQADRLASFMVDSTSHGGAIAKGTVRRYLAENAVEIGENVVRFRDGSEIQRANDSLAAEPVKRARGMHR